MQFSNYGAEDQPWEARSSSASSHLTTLQDLSANPTYSLTPCFQHWIPVIDPKPLSPTQAAQNSHTSILNPWSPMAPLIAALYWTYNWSWVTAQDSDQQGFWKSFILSKYTHMPHDDLSDRLHMWPWSHKITSHSEITVILVNMLSKYTLSYSHTKLHKSIFFRSYPLLSNELSISVLEICPSLSFHPIPS